MSAFEKFKFLKLTMDHFVVLNKSSLLSESSPTGYTPQQGTE